MVRDLCELVLHMRVEAGEISRIHGERGRAELEGINIVKMKPVGRFYSHQSEDAVMEIPRTLHVLQPSAEHR